MFKGQNPTFFAQKCRFPYKNAAMNHEGIHGMPQNDTIGARIYPKTFPSPKSPKRNFQKVVWGLGGGQQSPGDKTPMGCPDPMGSLGF